MGAGLRRLKSVAGSQPSPPPSPASGKGCFLAVMLGWVLSAGVGVVQAQTVYRCGNQYSQVPCVRSAVVDVGDPRTAAQEADGRRVAEMDRRLAETMRRDRLAAQYAGAYSSAINLGSRVADRRGPRTRLISIGGLPAGEAYP